MALFRHQHIAAAAAAAAATTTYQGYAPAPASTTPAALARSLYAQPRIGINFCALPPPVGAQFGLAPGQGIFITKVEPGSGAERAGVPINAILLAVDMASPCKTS